jgi:hypothetical protein
VLADLQKKPSRRTDADEIYILGIARNAQPLDRLKNKHKEFQKRMMLSSSFSSLPASASTSSPSLHGSSTPVLGSGTKRTVLGTTHTCASATTIHEDVFAGPSSSLPTTTTNARLQIYVDPSSSHPSLSTEDKTPYPDIGTRKTRIKENVPEVRKASGSTLKKGKRAVSGPGPGSAKEKIVVFRDDSEEMGPPPASTSGVGVKTPARKVVPFRDEPTLTTTVGFTPFRDEVFFLPSFLCQSFLI